ncbi:MAG: hypothetical protein WAV21_00600 [Minisyncoccia bacterium]
MRVWIAAGVFIVVGIGAFFVFVFRTGEDVPLEKDTEISAPVMTDLTFTHTYKTGTHTIRGAVTVPTRCITVAAKAIVDASSTPENIRLDLTAPSETGVCLRLPTNASFSVTAQANEDATLSIFENGVLATSTP